MSNLPSWLLWPLVAFVALFALTLLAIETWIAWTDFRRDDPITRNADDARDQAVRVDRLRAQVDEVLEPAYMRWCDEHSELWPREPLS